MKDRKAQKATIPLPNSLMKLIRQSEVYLMEEAVTESIIKQAHGEQGAEKRLMGSGVTATITEGDENAQKNHNEEIVDIKTYI